MAAKYSPEQDLVLWNGSKATDVKVEKVITEKSTAEETVTYKLKNQAILFTEEWLYANIDSLIESIAKSIKDNYNDSKTNP